MIGNDAVARDSFFNRWCWIGYPRAKHSKKNLHLYFTLHAKTDTKLSIDLKTKPCLEKQNRKIHLLGPRAGWSIFSYDIKNMLYVKKIIQEVDFLENENFCSTTYPVKNMERQRDEEILASHISDTGLIFKMINSRARFDSTYSKMINSQKSKLKKIIGSQNGQKAWRQYMESEQVLKKILNTISLILIGEMQIKTLTGYHYTSIRTKM